MKSNNLLEEKAPLIKRKLETCFPSAHFKLSSTNPLTECIDIDWYGSPEEYEVTWEVLKFDCGITYSHNGASRKIIVLPYNKAIEQPDKQGNFIAITPVCWDKAAEQQLKLVEFQMIASREIPIPENLPKGYQMNEHSSWLQIESELTDPLKIQEASFDEIDRLRDDWGVYQKAVGVTIESEIDRDDYWENLEAIEATWEPLDRVISDLTRKIDKKLISTYPLSQRSSSKAPSLENYLANSLGQSAAHALLVLMESLSISTEK
jgi:hypothetical protein